MKVKMVLVFFSVLLLFSCNNSDETAEYTVDSEVFEDALKLELEFGTENLPDEYLLARPRGIQVNDKNEVLVLDEDRIKVYDENGKPVKMFGRSGEGPGDFDNPFNLRISANGYITVRNSRGSRNILLFSPEGFFIRQKSSQRIEALENLLTERNFRYIWPQGIVIALNESESIFQIDPSEISESLTSENDIFLIYESDNSYKILTQYDVSNDISVVYNSERGPRTLVYGDPTEHLGIFLLEDLPDNRIVYTHTFHETDISENKAEYNLIIISPNSADRSVITRRFDPVELVYEPPKNPPSNPGFKKLNDKIESIYNERKVKSPLQALLTDRHYIFAFTFQENEIGEFFTDVLDADSGEYISSLYIPFIPDQIKNGYAYLLKRATQTEFAIIQKYRIDPSVYNK
ncbi:hypothetical protein ACFL7D_04835 [candidate division KSB1 bacterium]